MFATPHLSTKTTTVKGFSLIEDSIKTVFSISDNSNDCSYAVNKVIVGESDVTNIKKANKNVNETLRQYIIASELCMDIEKNLSNALCQLDGQVLEFYSPAITSQKQLPVYDENGNRRRIRRKPEELVGEKNHVCPYNQCEKSYTSKCSLYLHIKRNHGEDEEVKDGEIAPVRTNSKVKKGVNIYKVFKKSQAEKYECRVNFDSANTSDFNDREKCSFSDCISKKLYKSSPNTSAKTSIDLSDSTDMAMELKKYFSNEFTTNTKIEDANEIYAKEEIFSCEGVESRKTSFSIGDESDFNNFGIMSEELESAICLDFESDNMYEFSVSEDELFFENQDENQGEVVANAELSGILFNDESQHLIKREYEFLDFIDQNEEDLTGMYSYDVELNQVNAPFSLFI